MQVALSLGIRLVVIACVAAGTPAPAETVPTGATTVPASGVTPSPSLVPPTVPTAAPSAGEPTSPPMAAVTSENSTADTANDSNETGTEHVVHDNKSSAGGWLMYVILAGAFVCVVVSSVVVSLLIGASPNQDAMTSREASRKELFQNFNHGFMANVKVEMGSIVDAAIDALKAAQQDVRVLFVDVGGLDFSPRHGRGVQRKRCAQLYEAFGIDGPDLQTGDASAGSLAVLCRYAAVRERPGSPGRSTCDVWVAHTASLRGSGSLDEFEFVADVFLAILRCALRASAGCSLCHVKMPPLVDEPAFNLAALSLAYNWLSPSEAQESVRLRPVFCCGILQLPPPSSSSESDDDITTRKCCGCRCCERRGAEEQRSFERGKEFQSVCKQWIKQASRPPKGSGRLPALSGGKGREHDWIRENNDRGCRLWRLAAFCGTCRCVKAGAYSNGGWGSKRLSFVQQLPSATKVLSCAQGLPALPGNPRFDLKIELPRRRETVLDLAEACASDKAGSRTANRTEVCVINAASAYHPGGGFNTGGRHALEEALNTQSSLYVSLQAVSKTGREEASDMWSERKKPYFPEDGAILSPDVEVFREGSSKGYLFKASPFRVHVVSVAMCNRNARVRDAPVDAPDDPVAYERIVSAKLQATLHAAALSGAKHLVACDVGCGVFQNDETVVGRIFGQELVKFEGYFERVIFSGKPGFADAAVKAMAGSSCSYAVVAPEEGSDADSDRSDAALFGYNRLRCFRGSGGSRSSDDEAESQSEQPAE